MKTVLTVAALVFASAAVLQLFLPRRLPNAVVYCLCAWLLALTRKAL